MIAVTFTRTLAVLVAACSLTSCSLQPVEGEVLSTLPEQRYTDELIMRDWHAIEALSSRLEERRKDMSPYAAYKAGFLIEFAIDEYHENDRSGVIAWALNTARKLIEAPDAVVERELAHKVPPPGRYDALGLLVLDSEERHVLIEAQARAAKMPPCAAEAVARYYAGVIWLAHERWEVVTGLVKPGHENEALERLAARRRTMEIALKAAESSKTCTPDTSPPPVVVPRPPRGRDPEPPATPPKSNLRTDDVLFKYDGYTRADILPGGMELVAQLAEEWRERVAKGARPGLLPLPIKVVGHADRIGSASYNHRLSWRRAQTVRALLIEQGIPGDRIELNVLGAAKPVTVCAAEHVDGKFIECLAPDRRVEVTLPFAVSRPNESAR